MIDLSLLFSMDQKQLELLTRGMALHTRKTAMNIAMEHWDMRTVPCPAIARYPDLEELFRIGKAQCGNSGAVLGELQKFLTAVVMMDAARFAPGCYVVVPLGQKLENFAPDADYDHPSPTILGVGLTKDMALSMAARLNKGIRDTDVEVYRGTRRLFVLGHVQALEAGLHVPNFLDELFVIYEGAYDLAPDNRTRHLIWPELPQFPRLKVAFSLENRVEVFSFDHQSTEHFRYGPICAGKPILPTPGSPPLEGDELWPDVEDPDIHCREVANLAGAWPCDDLWEWFFVTNAATQLSALRSVHH